MVLSPVLVNSNVFSPVVSGKANTVKPGNFNVNFPIQWIEAIKTELIPDLAH